MTAALPKPVKHNNRLYFWRREIEAYKCELAGIPAPVREGFDELVATRVVAKELGVCRRTLGRRVRQAEKALTA